MSNGRIWQFKAVQFENNPRTGEALCDLKEVLKALIRYKCFGKWAFVIHDKDVYSQADYDNMVLTLVNEAKKQYITDETALNEYVKTNSWIEVGATKPKHCHIVSKLSTAWEIEKIAKHLGIPQFLIQKPDRGSEKTFLLDYTRYLTHESEDEQRAGKYRYPDEEIITSDSFKNWREELDKQQENEERYGKGKSKIQRIIIDVLKYGKTIRECHDEMDGNDYMRYLPTLERARAEYLGKTAEMPNTRINIYVDGGGGIGKDTACMLYAMHLAEQYFGFNPEIELPAKYIYCVGSEGVSFDSYDGQKILIWEEMRAATFIKRFGREGTLKMFDIHPKQETGFVNVKYGKTKLINAINLINGVEPYKDFLDGWAGEYKDKNGTFHEAEDKNQTYRRLPLIIALREEDFTLLINKGIFRGTREYQQYESYANMVGNFAVIANICGDNTAKKIEMAKPLLPHAIEAYAEVLKKCDKPEYTDEQIQAMIKDYGKVTGGIAYERKLSPEDKQRIQEEKERAEREKQAAEEKRKAEFEKALEKNPALIKCLEIPREFTNGSVTYLPMLTDKEEIENLTKDEVTKNGNN